MELIATFEVAAQWLFAMSRRKDKGRIEGPFVPMLIPTISSPAWRAMSPNARVVYMTLKSRYSNNSKNNGRIYLSARDGTLSTLVIGGRFLFVE
jgi:hypothetical protein